MKRAIKSVKPKPKPKTKTRSRSRIPLMTPTLPSRGFTTSAPSHGVSGFPILGQTGDYQYQLRGLTGGYSMPPITPGVAAGVPMTPGPTFNVPMTPGPSVNAYGASYHNPSMGAPQNFNAQSHVPSSVINVNLNGFTSEGSYSRRTAAGVGSASVTETRRMDGASEININPEVGERRRHSETVRDHQDRFGQRDLNRDFNRVSGFRTPTDRDSPIGSVPVRPVSFLPTIYENGTQQGEQTPNVEIPLTQNSGPSLNPPVTSSQASAGNTNISLSFLTPANQQRGYLVMMDQGTQTETMPTAPEPVGDYDIGYPQPTNPTLTRERLERIQLRDQIRETINSMTERFVSNNQVVMASPVNSRASSESGDSYGNFSFV